MIQTVVQAVLQFRQQNNNKINITFSRRLSNLFLVPSIEPYFIPTMFVQQAFQFLQLKIIPFERSSNPSYSSFNQRLLHPDGCPTCLLDPSIDILMHQNVPGSSGSLFQHHLFRSFSLKMVTESSGGMFLFFLENVLKYFKKIYI